VKQYGISLMLTVTKTVNIALGRQATWNEKRKWFDEGNPQTGKITVKNGEP
jgi:hypothetical protein